MSYQKFKKKKACFKFVNAQSTICDVTVGTDCSARSMTAQVFTPPLEISLFFCLVKTSVSEELSDFFLGEAVEQRVELAVFQRS